MTLALTILVVVTVFAFVLVGPAYKSATTLTNNDDYWRMTLRRMINLQKAGAIKWRLWGWIPANNWTIFANNIVTPQGFVRAKLERLPKTTDRHYINWQRRFWLELIEDPPPKRWVITVASVTGSASQRDYKVRQLAVTTLCQNEYEVLHLMTNTLGTPDWEGTNWGWDPFLIDEGILSLLTKIGTSEFAVLESQPAIPGADD